MAVCSALLLTIFRKWPEIAVFFDPITVAPKLFEHAMLFLFFRRHGHWLSAIVVAPITEAIWFFRKMKASADVAHVPSHLMARVPPISGSRLQSATAGALAYVSLYKRPKVFFLLGRTGHQLIWEL